MDESPKLMGTKWGHGCFRNYACVVGKYVQSKNVSIRNVGPKYAGLGYAHCNCMVSFIYFFRL